MSHKVYRVRISQEIVVYAEDAQNAVYIAKQAERDGDVRYDYTATLAKKGNLPSGWYDHTLVYHEGKEDMTVASAFLHSDSE